MQVYLFSGCLLDDGERGGVMGVQMAVADISMKIGCQTVSPLNKNDRVSMLQSSIISTVRDLRKEFVGIQEQACQLRDMTSVMVAEVTEKVVCYCLCRSVSHPANA